MDEGRLHWVREARNASEWHLSFGHRGFECGESPAPGTLWARSLPAGPPEPRCHACLTIIGRRLGLRIVA